MREVKVKKWEKDRARYGNGFEQSDYLAHSEEYESE